MIEFAVGRYGDADYRLMKWDGATETEINTGWDHRPTDEDLLHAIMDHHRVGDSPFNSREAAIDSYLIVGMHIPEIDREAGHPWPWER